MEKEKAITDFNKKLITPLFEDIRRTLEVTCDKTGEDNHGSNFIGNAVVLLGIESVAQFTDPNTKEDHILFKKQAKEYYKKITKEQKDY